MEPSFLASFAPVFPVRFRCPRCIAADSEPVESRLTLLDIIHSGDDHEVRMQYPGLADVHQHGLNRGNLNASTSGPKGRQPPTLD